MCEEEYNMLNPKISFIVPVYNVSDYLEQCVNSLLMQAIEKEIILVDDASTDSSGKMCDDFSLKYPEIIKIIHQPRNQGLSCARNMALKTATGRYIMFVDSDDYLRFDCASMLYRIAAENDLEFLRCSYLNCTNDDSKYIPRALRTIEQEGKVINGRDYLQRTIHTNTYEVIVCSALIERNFIVEHTLWFAEGYYYEDHEWTLRMLLNCDRAMICTLPIYAYRINPKGTVQTMTLDKVKSSVLLARRIADQIEDADVNEQERGYLYAALALLVYHASGIYGRISEKDRKEAGRLILELSFWDKLLAAPTPAFIHRKLWAFKYAKVLVDLFYLFRKGKK